MSTKTTLKRIALVAVSALGFGLLATAPARAAAGSISLRNASVTVVDATSATATFIVTMKSNAATPVAANLGTGEYITVETISTPNIVDSSTKAGTLTFTPVQSNLSSALTVTDGIADSTSEEATNNPYDSTSATDGTGVYYLNVVLPDNAANAGSYTIRFKLRDATGVISTVDAKVASVSSADYLSGATISIAKTASSMAASTQLGQDVTTAVDVTVRDANSGLIVTSKMSTLAPTADMTLAGVSCDTADVISDGGEATGDYDDQTASDGVFSYKITSVDTSCVGSASIRARIVGAVTATSAVTVTAAASGTATGYISATGKYSASSTAITHDVPLTTKSVTSYIVDGSATTGKAYYYSVAYTGCVVADMSLDADTLTKVLTDSTGVASVTLTHSNPLDNCQAVFTWTGATMTRGTHTVVWNAPVATTVVSNPGGNIQALLKSTNKVTWTILDQYGAPVAGKTATFTMSGKNAPTTGLASQVTDANGQVSYSWTDALATADTTDTVGINEVGADNLDAGNVTITYKSALSAVAKLKAEYDLTTHNFAAPVLVPTTNIGGAAGLANSGADQIDTSKAITVPSSGDPAAHWVALKFTAQTSADVAVTGVPTTVTVTNGFLIGSDTKIATSRIVYANDLLWVLGLKTGVVTVTATNGSVTSTAKINFVNVKEDARVLTLTESAGTYTATVTDFYGNAVSGADVDVTASGGRLGNGASFATFKTATNGTVTFDVTGASTVTASLGSTYTKASFLANAGDATGAVVTTGAPAGVRTVSLATSGKTDAAATAAEAASDAAAEAIDAANAATDAANLAAEAADAATVAAEEARDAADAATAAVEELATQVATLMAALKAQITTLANTVAKIAKKVKA